MDTATINEYLKRLTQIEHIANHLLAFVDDHGGMDPDDIEMQHVSQLDLVLHTLRQATALAGIELK